MLTLVVHVIFAFAQEGEDVPESRVLWSNAGDGHRFKGT